MRWCNHDEMMGEILVAPQPELWSHGHILEKLGNVVYIQRHAGV